MNTAAVFWMDHSQAFILFGTELSRSRSVLISSISRKTVVQSIKTVHAWSHQQQASAGSRGQSVSSLKDDSCLLQKDTFSLCTAPFLYHSQ